MTESPTLAGVGQSLVPSGEDCKSSKGLSETSQVHGAGGFLVFDDHWVWRNEKAAGLVHCVPVVICGLLLLRTLQWYEYILLAVHTATGAISPAVLAAGILNLSLAAYVHRHVDSMERLNVSTIAKLQDEQQFLESMQSCLQGTVSCLFHASCICNQQGKILPATAGSLNLFGRGGELGKYLTSGSDLFSHIIPSGDWCPLKRFMADVSASGTHRPQTIVVSFWAGRVVKVEISAVLLPSRSKHEKSEQDIFIGLQALPGASDSQSQGEASSPDSLQQDESSTPIRQSSEPVAATSRLLKGTPGKMRTAFLSSLNPSRSAGNLVSSGEDGSSTSTSLISTSNSACSLSSKTPSMRERRRQFAGLSIDCRQAKSERSDALKGSAIDQYTILKKLGKGSTSVVHSALRKADSQPVVLKIVGSEDLWVATEKEYELLRTIDHPNIIRTYDLFVSPRGAVLVLEFFHGDTLTERMHGMRPNSTRGFSEKTACCLFKALLKAVCYLHKRQIIHRDIKPDNLMVANDAQDLRVLDFNAAKSLASGGALTMTGTQLYQAPECLSGEPPVEANDVFGSGMCLYFMLSGRLPWRPDMTPMCRAEYMSSHPLKLTGPVWENKSDRCKSVLRQSLYADKRLRPTADALMKYEWLWQEESQPSDETSPASL